MKSALVSLGLLLLIVVLVFVEMAYVEKSLNEMIGDVGNIVEAYHMQDNKAVNDQINALEEKWQKQQGIYCIVVRRNELNDIATAIKKMRIYSQYLDSALFEAESESIKIWMKQIVDAEKAKMSNFF